jgi:hypothetical protein
MQRDLKNLRYEIGKTYVYDYESNTKLDLRRDDEQSPVYIKARVEISVLDTCELALQLREVVARGPVDVYALKAALEAAPLMFGYDDGVITRVCSSPDDQDWAINVKKGVLSALQVSASKSLSGQSIVRETDILGTCDTTYEVVSRDYRGVTIQKTKDMRSCINRHEAVLSLFPREYNQQADYAIQSAPLTRDEYACTQQLKDDIIAAVTCQEKNVLLAGSAAIETKTALKFLRRMDSQLVRQLDQHRPQQLLYASNPRASRGDERTVTELLREICSKVVDDVKQDVPAKFNELVRQLSNLDYSVVQRVYDAVRRNEMCQSDKLKDIFLDAAANDASEGSVKLIVDMIEKKEIKEPRATYYLTLISMSSQPSEGAVRALTQLLKSQRDDAPRATMLGMSAMVRNLCQHKKSACHRQNPIIEEAVEALTQKVESAKRDTKVIAALKSLENIGSQIGNRGRDAILRIAEEKSRPDAVRVAALDALKEIANDDKVQQKLLDIFKREDENAEIRIVAYRTMMKDPKREIVKRVLEQLEKEPSKQVGAYVVSHMENVQHSHDPHKRHVREMLARESIPVHKFPRDIRKFSRNVEYSYVHEATNMGGVVDADIIYAKSFAPRQLVLNVTVPVWGKSINLVEVGLRQRGLERELERAFGPNGKLMSSKNVNEMLRDAMDFFAEAKNEVRDRRASNSRLSLLDERTNFNNQETEGSVYVKVDGKIVAYLDINDLDDQVSQSRDVISSLMDKLSSRMKVDRAFAVQLVDTEVKIPTSNGMPIKLDVNATLVAAVKAETKMDLKGLEKRNNKDAYGELLAVPSFALELSAAMKVDAHSSEPGMKVVARLSSGPAVQAKAELKEGRIANIEFALPKDKQNLIKFSQKVMIIDASGNEREMKSSRHAFKQQHCTKSLHKPLGITICAMAEAPRPFIDFERMPFVQGPVNAEISIEKTDKSMRSYKLDIEVPARDNREMKVLRVAFATPGSQIDREVSIEAQLSQPRGQSRSARVQLKSPWKQLVATAAYKNEQQEVSGKAELIVDTRDKYAVELGYTKDVGSGRKSEYRPRVRIELPQQQPIAMSGSIIFSQGRKNSLSIDLHEDGGSNRQYIRGQFVKEGDIIGPWQKDFSLSTDVTASLPQLELRIAGTSERQQQGKVISSDVTVEYQRGRRQKHSVKFTTKLQNLSSGSKLTKLNAFAEMRTTQYPEYNWHVQYNGQIVPDQHCENELLVRWRDQMTDDRRKIQILQVTTMQQNSVDARVSALIAPINVNYEARVTGERERGETPKFKVEVTVKDKASRDQKEARGSFEYRLSQRKPLRLSMDARLKVPSREMSYHDELTEQSPGEYRGKTSVQWQTGKVATLAYAYRVKPDSWQIEYQLDTPRRQQHAHGKTLLRLARDTMELRSQTHYEGQQLYNLDSTLSRSVPSRFQLETARGIVKCDSSHFANTIPTAARITNVDINVRDWQHKSNIQTDAESFALKSETKARGKQLYALDSYARKNANEARLKFESQPCDLKFQLEPRDNFKRNVNWELNKRGRYPLVHTTSATMEPEQFQLKSRTEYRSQPYANIDAILSKRDRSSVNVDCPYLTGQFDTTMHNKNARVKNVNVEFRTKHEPLTHTSSLIVEPSMVKFESKTTRREKPLANINALYSRDALSKFDLETPKYTTQFQCDPYNRMSKSAALEIAAKDSKYRHKSTLAVERDNIKFNSRTDSYRGEPLATIDSLLSRQSRSQLEVKTPRWTSKFDVEPFARVKSAVLDFSHGPQDYKHISKVQYDGDEMTFESNTDARGDKLIKVESRVSRKQPSYLDLKSKHFDGRFDIDHVSPVKRCKLDIQNRKGQYGHQTTLEVQPQEIKFASRTDSRGQRVLNIDSLLSKKVASNLAIDCPKLQGRFDIDPYQRVKIAKVDLKGKQSKWAHNTEVIYEPAKFQLKSRTDNKRGEVLAKIDSLLQRQGESKLNWEIPHHIGAFNVDPYSQMKRSKIELKGKRQPWAHTTEITYEPAKVELKSRTDDKQGKPFVTVNSILSRKSQSKFDLDIPQFVGSFNVDPYSPMKRSKIELKGKRQPWAHTTEINYEPAKVELKSRTDDKQGKQFVTVNSILSRKSQSKFDLDIPQFVGSLNIDPYSRVKRSIIDLKGKRQPWAHKTEISYEPAKFELKSRTDDKYGKPYVTVDSLLQRQGESRLNWDIPHHIAAFNVDPYSQIKRSQIDLKGKQSKWAHNTEIIYDPLKIELKSRTADQYGKPCVAINSILARRGESKLDWDIPHHIGSFNVDPYSQMKRSKFELKGKRQPWAHTTEVTYEPAKFELKSRTDDKYGKPLATVNSILSRKSQSKLDLDIPHMIGSFDVNPYAQIKTSNIELRGKSSPWQHKTFVTVEPHQIKIQSVTHDKRGQKLADLDSLLSKKALSNIKLEIPTMTGQFELDPYSRAKKSVLEVRGKQSPWQHKTEIIYDPLKVELKSRTDNKRGVKVAQLDALLSKRERSQATFDSEYFGGYLHVDPLTAQKKSIAFELNGKRGQQLQHKSKIEYDNGKLDFTSTTTKDLGKRVLDIDSRFDRRAPSHINIVSPLFDSKLNLDLTRQDKKMAAIEMNGKLVDFAHSSHFAYAPMDSLTLKSRTHYRQQPVAVIDAQLMKRGESRFDCESPLFNAKTAFDKQNKRVTVDIRSKYPHERRVLMAVRAPNSNGYELDLKWDADRDQNKRIVITADGQRTGQQVQLHVNTRYGQQLFESDFNARMSRYGVIEGPHDFEWKVTAPEVLKEPMTLTFHHEITSDGQLQCVARFLKSGVQKIRAETSGKSYFGRDGSQEVRASVKVTSTYKDIDGMLVSIDHMFKPKSANSFEMKTQLRAQATPTNAYKAEAQLNKEYGQLRGRVALDTPMMEYRSQQVNLDASWERDKVRAEANVMSHNGKELQLNAQADKSHKAASLAVELESNIKYIPGLKLQAAARAENQKKSVEMTLDVDRDRKLDLNAAFTKTDAYNFDAHLTADSKWSPRVQLNVDGQRDRSWNALNYGIVLKKDADEIVAAKLQAQKRPRGQQAGWVGSALVASHGAELARLDLEHDLLSSDEANTVFKVRAKDQSPLKLQFKNFASRTESRPSVTICYADRADKCVTLEGAYKNDDKYGKYDRTLNMLVKKSPHAQATFMWHFNNKKTTDNKVAINVNGHALGYAFVYDKDNKVATAQLTLPSRTIESRIQKQEGRNGDKIAFELIPDAIRSPNEKVGFELSHKDVQARGDRDIATELRIMSHTMERPISIQVHLQSKDPRMPQPLMAKAIFDLSPRDPKKALTLTTWVETSVEDARNKTIAFSVNNKRADIDFQVKSHIAALEGRFTTGLNWMYMNRRGQRRQGFYLLKTTSDDKRVEIWARDPIVDTHAYGTWEYSDDQQLNVALAIDSRNFNEQRKANLVVDMKKPCAELTLMRGAATPTNKFHACFDTTTSNVLRLSAETYDEGAKITDASISFDKRGGRTLKAHIQWSPERLGEIIYALGSSNSNPLASLNDVIPFGDIHSDVAQKSRDLVSSVANEVIVPLASFLADELEELVEEMAANFGPINNAINDLYYNLPRAERIQQLMQKLSNALYDLRDAMIPDSMIDAVDRNVRRVTRAMKRACSKDSACFRLAQEYEKNGAYATAEQLAEEMVYAARKAHRFVVTSRGAKFLKSLPSPYEIRDKLAQRYPVFAEMLDKMAQYNDNVARKYYELKDNVALKVDKLIRMANENENVRALLEATSRLVRKVAREMSKNSNFDKIATLSQQAIKLIASPATWASHSRVIVWDPQGGEIEVEIRAPFEYRQLKQAWSQASRQYNSVSDKFSTFRSSVMSEWAPPFSAQAQLIGGQHFVTFDRKFYDFAGQECSYVLARDFVDGNFSVIAKYRGLDNSGRVKKSLLVQLGNRQIEIAPQQQQVKLDSRDIELPLFLGSASILRRSDSIIVDDKKKGIIVECQLSHDVCTVAVSGWFFGKTAGLMGTYDYEPENDWMRPGQTQYASSSEEFARSWEAESSCRTTNVARNQDIQRGSEAYELCHQHFMSEKSPLRKGFAVVKPDEYFKMCLRHMSASRGHMQPSRAVCTIASAYVTALRHRNLRVPLPQTCLACANGQQFASQQHVPVTRRSADIVYVVEEHECARALVDDIDHVARLMERELNNEGFENNQYGVVGFGGTRNKGEPHVHTSRGKLLFDVHDVVLATENIEYRARANQGRAADAIHALATAANSIPWRAGASKNVILITCTKCGPSQRLAYSDIQRALLQQGITVHVLNDRSIQVKSASEGKQRGVLGVDADTVYRAKDVTQKQLRGQQTMRTQVAIPKDICVALAQESNGAFFSTQALATSEAKTLKSLLARRVVMTAKPEASVVCECVPAADDDVFAAPRQVCRPLVARKPRQPLSAQVYTQDDFF